MANDPQQLFTLTSDGISLEFFNLLWTKDELNFGPAINIPDTIVYKMGTPANWFFTSSNGKIKRKNRQNLMNARIEEAFTKYLLGYDVIATFIHIESTEEDGGRDDSVGKNKPLTIEYLDRNGLTDFLYKRRERSNGILQRFVEPKGIKNEMIRAIWSPKVCLLERSENIHQLHDQRFGLFERCVTFEGPEYYYTSAPLRGPVLAGQLQKICESVVNHVSEVTFAQQQINRMVLNLKVDSRDKIWLLFSTSIRCAGTNEDLVQMRLNAPNDGGVSPTNNDVVGFNTTGGGLTMGKPMKSLVNIGSVIELPEYVNLNPNKSYEKLKMKSRIQCISCANESMEDNRYPITYKSVIKHYEHTLQLMMEVSGRSLGLNILDWPPDAEIIEAAGGVGFGCLKMVGEFDALSRPGKLDMSKPLEVDELRIPPILRYVHTNLSSRSYSRCRRDPLFLYKTVTCCESCYLVYAEFSTMLLRLGQDLTKMLQPDPAAVNIASSTLKDTSLARPSSADWRSMSAVNRGGSSDMNNMKSHQAGYILPSKQHSKAKKSAIGIRSQDVRQKPTVPGMIRKNKGGVAGVLRNSQSMNESMNHPTYSSIDMDAQNMKSSSQQELSFQHGMQMNSSLAGVGSMASSALGYEPQDVHAMIEEREKNFFNEISANPQLKDQHPLMHLIANQKKLKMVDEQAGVFSSSQSATAEPVFSHKYGKQADDKFDPFGIYLKEAPYILQGKIIKPSKWKAMEKAKKDKAMKAKEDKIAKKKFLKSLNSVDEIDLASTSGGAGGAGATGSAVGVFSAPPSPDAAGIATGELSPRIGGLDGVEGGVTIAPSVTSTSITESTTISAQDISSKKHSDFLKQTLRDIEKEVASAASYRDKSVTSYKNTAPPYNPPEKRKGTVPTGPKMTGSKGTTSNSSNSSKNGHVKSQATSQKVRTNDISNENGSLDEDSTSTAPIVVGSAAFIESNSQIMGGVGSGNDLDNGFDAFGSTGSIIAGDNSLIGGINGSMNGLMLDPDGLDTNSATLLSSSPMPNYPAPGSASTTTGTTGRPGTSATSSRPSSVEGL